MWLSRSFIAIIIGPARIWDRAMLEILISLKSSIYASSAIRLRRPFDPRV